MVKKRRQRKKPKHFKVIRIYHSPWGRVWGYYKTSLLSLPFFMVPYCLPHPTIKFTYPLCYNPPFLLLLTDYFSCIMLVFPGYSSPRHYQIQLIRILCNLIKLYFFYYLSICSIFPYSSLSFSLALLSVKCAQVYVSYILIVWKSDKWIRVLLNFALFSFLIHFVEDNVDRVWIVCRFTDTPSFCNRLSLFMHPSISAI